VFQLGGVAVIVSFNCSCLAGFFKFSSSTLGPDLHNCVAFFKTRPPQLRFTSSFAPAAGSTGYVGVLDHALPFLALHGVGWGLRWSIYSWVVPLTTRVLHVLPSPVESAVVSTAGSLFFGFFLLCVLYSPCFLVYNLHVYCLNFIGIFVG
jgi:hypothetical protein